MNKPGILTLLQHQCLEFLFSDKWFRRYFYLTGGTALAAFYLQHRYSDDLDFFSHHVTLDSIPHLMRGLEKAMDQRVQQVQKSPAFMRYRVGDELQIDIVGDVAFRVGAPELMDRFMVDSPKNIAVNKVCCILGRLDIKDYIDLYLLLNKKKYDILELLSLAREKDSGLDVFVWASLIGDVDRLKVLPRMLDPFSLKELQSFFHQLRDQLLDTLKPRK